MLRYARAVLRHRRAVSFLSPQEARRPLAGVLAVAGRCEDAMVRHGQWGADVVVGDLEETRMVTPILVVP